MRNTLASSEKPLMTDRSNGGIQHGKDAVHLYMPLPSMR